MTDPLRRIAAWLFATAIAIPALSIGHSALARSAQSIAPLTSAARPSVQKAVPTPAFTQAEVVAVAATPTPTPTPEPTPVPTVEYVPPAPTYAAPISRSSVIADFEARLRAATIARWGTGEWPSMRTLIYNESGMNPYAINRSSGACSAFQALPCAKLGVPLSDFDGQISWGIGYSTSRYGTPSAALAFWHCIGQCGEINKTATWY